MSEASGGGADGGGRRARRLTVAAVREPPGADCVEVLFLESARFYRLPRSHPEFVAMVGRLQASAEAGRPLEVTFAAEDETEISEVEGGVAAPPGAPSG